jgi:hypothetical protein
MFEKVNAQITIQAMEKTSLQKNSLEKLHQIKVKNRQTSTQGEHANHWGSHIIKGGTTQDQILITL